MDAETIDTRVSALNLLDPYSSLSYESGNPNCLDKFNILNIYIYNLMLIFFMLSAHYYE